MSNIAILHTLGFYSVTVRLGYRDSRHSETYAAELAPRLSAIESSLAGPAVVRNKILEDIKEAANNVTQILPAYVLQSLMADSEENVSVAGRGWAFVRRVMVEELFARLRCSLTLSTSLSCVWTSSDQNFS